MYSLGEPASATDAAGNIYLTGSFSGTAHFGSIQLHDGRPVGSYRAAPYVAKYDRKGGLRWASTFGGDRDAQVMKISIAPDENILVLGKFTDTLLLDGQTFINREPFGYGSFIAKLSRRGGGVIWARQLGGLPTDMGSDNNGNVFVCGVYMDSMKLDQFQLLADTSGDFPYYTFVAHLNAAGQPDWLKSSLYSIDLSDPKISVNDGGTAIVSWTPAFLISFKTAATQSTPTQPDYLTSYLANFTSKGRCAWVKPVGTGFVTQSALFTDVTGVTYVAGSYKGDAVFGKDTLHTLVGQPYIDFWGDSVPGDPMESAFLSKVGKHGQVLWTRSITGTEFARVTAITLDKEGGIWTAGNFLGTASLVSGNDTLTYTSSGSSDLFMTRYSTAGAFEWMSTAGGPGDEYSSSISTDHLGNGFVAGVYGEGAVFGSHQSTGANYQNVFLTRITQPVPAARESQPAIASGVIDLPITLSAYPNPFTDQIALTLDAKQAGTAVITVSDLSGRVMASHSIVLSNGPTQVPLDLSSLIKGAYLLSVQTGEHTAHSRLIKQ